jgi:8-oxo-dGTP diphosphatase
MARNEILAAGGVVVRGMRTPLIAVVQRSKDGWWVLPKGKLKREESALAAAKREVVEETGVDVSVQEFLGAISYEVSSGPKLVQFWRMQMIEGPGRALMDDIMAVEWLPLPDAIKRLNYPVEQMFLRGIGSRVTEQPALAPRRKSVARKTVAVRKVPASPAKVARKAAVERIEDTAALPLMPEPNTEAPAVVANVARPNLVQRLMRRITGLGNGKQASA